MDIKERQRYRLEILFDLYDYYFTSGGLPYEVKYENLHRDALENETHCVYEYLLAKGFITYKQILENCYLAQITSNGIDYLEGKINELPDKIDEIPAMNN
ncbi:hypothetical protein [Bacillus sp. EAC]|uniref:hypothetical protein n=1 Tax=Bacillus sp. EAC TaxID=1978338 RepID=UPI000B435488|nr:hypothetical protein [Bacillus sp. EAC]